MRKPTSNFTPDPKQPFVVKSLQALNCLFTRIYHRLSILSPPQLPKTGPAILISNHTSGLDPLLLQSVNKRMIVWMMAKEYYELPALKPIFKSAGAIPVDRAARDTAAVRAALRALQDGRILGIFPEGRISTKKGELLPFQHGVAQMAIKTGVPVYPAFLNGSQYGVPEMLPAFLHRQQCTVRFGPAIEFDRSSTSREALAAVTMKLQASVDALRS
jgi:1-acyl-sn-glycerol-3-phosphate acyltransferase